MKSFTIASFVTTMLVAGSVSASETADWLGVYAESQAVIATEQFERDYGYFALTNDKPTAVRFVSNSPYGCSAIHIEVLGISGSGTIRARGRFLNIDGDLVENVEGEMQIPFYERVRNTHAIPLDPRPWRGSFHIPWDDDPFVLMVSLEVVGASLQKEGGGLSLSTETGEVDDFRVVGRVGGVCPK